MRIAVYLQGTLPSEGGGFTFQEELLRALRRQAPKSSHEWVVFSAGHLEPSDRVHCVKLNRGILTKMWSRLARALNRTQELWLGAPKIYLKSAFDQSLVDHQIDWVWFVSPADLPCDLPFTYTMWDLQHAYQPWFPEVSAKGEWEVRENRYRGLFPKASRVIVPNAVAEREVCEWYRIPKSRVLRLGHPTPSWALNAKPLGKRNAKEQVESWYGVKGPYFFYPAQMWAHKNHATLIRALAILKREKWAKVTLVFSGSDRGNREYLEKLARELGVSEQIAWLGFVPSERLQALYEGAEALAFASLFGPENLPPLEASALGTRVIASEVDGGREQFAGGVTWVKGLDAKAWAEAMISVMGEDQATRDREVETARSRARSVTYDGYVKSVIGDFDQWEATRSLWR